MRQIEQLHSETSRRSGAVTRNRTLPQWHPPVCVINSSLPDSRLASRYYTVEPMNRLFCHARALVRFTPKAGHLVPTSRHRRPRA